MNTSRATTSLAPKGGGGAATGNGGFGKPPPGYVAGVGRGASGFTTRSDVGPAAAPVGAGAAGRGDTGPIGMRALRIGERGGARGGAGDGEKAENENEAGNGVQERDGNLGQFDQFLGNDAGMYVFTLHVLIPSAFNFFFVTV